MVCPITQGDHKKKPQDENIMVCPIPQGDHNKEDPVDHSKGKKLVNDIG